MSRLTSCVHILASLLSANAGFNAYVLVKHPTFEQAQRTHAQSEITDFLAANPAWTQKAVSLGLSAAASSSAPAAPPPPPAAAASPPMRGSSQLAMPCHARV